VTSIAQVSGQSWGQATRTTRRLAGARVVSSGIIRILSDVDHGAGYSSAMARENFRPLPTVTLPDGARVPALGLGTWHMGESARRAEREVAALTLGLDLGMTLVDTAEMYGDGGAEERVGTALAGRPRQSVFVVSKVLPHHADARGVRRACEASLRRLGTDHLDLYLLHWRGRVPLAQTVEGFHALVDDGLIRRWGVSNFDVDDMEALYALPGGDACATNQVLYNLSERAVEWRLMKWCRARRVTLMAYSPVGQGALLRSRKLAAIARSAGATPAQLALAWAMRHPDVMAIPQSTDPAHLRENRAAAGLRLTAATLAALDDAFPPPRQATTISVI
jgi:diketogulonate reductase-like aldo/keto reductase